MLVFAVIMLKLSWEHLNDYVTILSCMPFFFFLSLTRYIEKAKEKCVILLSIFSLAN